MSSQKAKKSSASSAQQENLQQEKLQAILVLESYTRNFMPLSMDRAECLMPMAGGKTLLDHTLQYLVDNEVEEIYLFCTKHQQQIRDYLNTKKWNVELHFLYNVECQSLGDAMREIDAKGLIRSNFILVTASGLLSNIKLKEYLERHKQTSKTDKNTIMTMLCLDKQSDLSRHSKLNNDLASTSSTLIMHNESNRLVHYDQIDMENKKKKSFKYAKIPYELLDIIKTTCKDAKTSGPCCIHHRTNLVETQIYFCSPYVLHIFTDSFDFQNMAEFIHGALTDSEVSGYTIYVDTIRRKFGDHFSFVNNLNTYYFEFMRLLQRIDILFPNLRERANYCRMVDKLNVYISTKDLVKQSENLRLDHNVLIDANCSIGDNVELFNCYLGPNVKIGNNCKLSNCIIWPYSTVCDNSTLNACVLGYNVTIGTECTISENVLLANNVRVKNKTHLNVRGVYMSPNNRFEVPGETKVTDLLRKGVTSEEENYSKYTMTNCYSQGDDDDDDEFGDSDIESGAAVSSSAGPGSSMSDSESDTNESINDTSKNKHFLVWKNSNTMRHHRHHGNQPKNLVLGYLSLNDYDLSSEHSETSSEDEIDDDNDSINSDDAPVASTQQVHSHDEQAFFDEVIEILKRGLKENLSQDNLVLEINACKHAYYIQIDDLCFLLARAILKLPILLRSQVTASKTNAFEYLESLKNNSLKFVKLIQNYYASTKQSQMTFLDSLLDFCLSEKNVIRVNADGSETLVNVVDNYYVKILHFFFNEFEFLKEENIFEWRRKQDNLNDDEEDENYKREKTRALTKLEPFLKWLEEADEEDDDDDDDDDDDE